MKRVNKEDLEINESYLVDTSFKWSPSGFDIAEYSYDKTLISQSNGQNIIEYAIAIYELPASED